MGKKNLILVADPSVNHEPSFKKICSLLADEAPDISPAIVMDTPRRKKKWLHAFRPTMVFSPVPLKRFHPVRGKVFAGQDLVKSQEYAVMDQAGISVPKYVLLTEQNPRQDVSALGDYVVLKPDRGLRGANVRIVRAKRAVWEPSESAGGKNPALLAQEFIYTGPWPISYRVTTLFGQVLWSTKLEADRSRNALEGPDQFAKAAGVSIVASSKGCNVSLCYDENILRFGESVHAAFPDIPLLGIDIVQRQTDGKLFVVEVNASGWVWHFNSPMGMRFQAEFGYTLESQFDGIHKASRILAEKTRQFAV